MKLTIYAITFIVACFIVCCTAGPSGIDSDSVIVGVPGDCCEYVSLGFCGRIGGTGSCDTRHKRDKCRKTTDEMDEICKDHNLAVACENTGCINGSHEQCGETP